MPADRSAAVNSGADFYRIHPGKDRGNYDWGKMAGGFEFIISANKNSII